MERQVTDSDRSRIQTLKTVGERPVTAATVIIVTYEREKPELLDTLNALGDQTVDSFETIVLDNGTDWDLESLLADIPEVTHYVEFTENYGVNVARNVGAKLAQGDLLIFLDDDGIPAPNFVEEHLSAHQTHDIVAARGKIRPKSATFYNRLATWYDLGNQTFPYLLDVEGNTSVDRDIYFEVSGFSEEIWGHEGVELTNRLIKHSGRERVIYYPDAVIYHDFVNDIASVVRKKARHRYYRRELEDSHPELFSLFGQYADVPATRGGDWSFPVKSAVFLVNRATNYFARLFESRFVCDGGASTE